MTSLSKKKNEETCYSSFLDILFNTYTIYTVHSIPKAKLSRMPAVRQVTTTHCKNIDKNEVRFSHFVEALVSCLITVRPKPKSRVVRKLLFCYSVGDH